MVARPLRLSPIGKLGFVVAVLGVLIGCLVGGRSILHRQQGASTIAEESSPSDSKTPGGWYSVQITRAEWKPAWLGSASSSTFTGEAEIQSLHGFVFVAFGEMRIKDSSGRLVRSWLQVKRIRCSKHATDSDKIEGHRGTASFVFTWDGNAGTGQPVPEGSSTWEFSVRFRLKKDSRTGTIGIDKTAPAITISEPQGEIAGTSASLVVTWHDSASGIDPSSGQVSLDGSPLSGLSIDATGARGSLNALSEGSHTIAATVKDFAGNGGSASGTFTVKLPGAVEQRTGLLGTVADSSGSPLAGVSVSSSSATGTVTTDSEGKFFIEMTSGGQHWLSFDKDGFIPVARWADVTENQNYNLGDVRMVAQDPRVSTVGPEGGTARDSSGDVELEIPAGALSEPVDIRMTHIPSGKELPGPLNASDNLQYPIDYLLCVAIEPADLGLSSPATLRYPNKWGFKAGEQIPTALWDGDSNRWVPDGGYMTVNADASKFEKTLASLGISRTSKMRASSATAPSRLRFIDCNAGTASRRDPGSTDSDADDKDCTPSNSTLTISDSGYRKSIALPGVSGPGGGQTLSLTYKSATAYPTAFINHLQYFGPDDKQSIYDWTYEVEVNGAWKAATFSPPTDPSRLLFFWDGRTGHGDLSPTGLYTSTAISTVRYEAPYYTNETTWGGAPTGVTSGRSPRPAEKRRIIKEPLALVNRSDSPYGAGWSLSGLRQLYPQPDGKVLQVEGGDAGTIYYPYMNFARLREGASIVGVVQGTHAGDPRNMIGYHAATRSAFEEIDYRDSFGFNWNTSEDWDWVVVDLGQVRQIHTLGLSFHTIEPGRNPLLAGAVIRIYVSLDNVDWTLWSEASEDIIDGMTAAKLTSPYLAGKDTAQPTRYVKYMMYAPSVISPLRNYVNEVYRLYAFGPSENYGNGKNGQDEDYPKLTRLEQGGWEQTERDGTRFLYDGNGLLQSVTDAHGMATTYAWTGDGMLTEITDAAGGVTRFDYSGGKLRQITDVAGRRTSFTVDANGDLTQVTMPDGSTSILSYDSRHLIQTQTDALGELTTYTWDPVYPNLRKTTGPGGREITTDAGYFKHLINGVTGTEQSPAPSPGFQMESTRTDELGRVTSYKWEAYGSGPDFLPLYRSTITDLAGRTTERYLHPRMRGLEAMRVEPDGSKIRNTYDAEEARFVLKVEDLSEASAYRVKGQYTYEPVFRKIATSTDIGGHTTSYSYGEKGDLTSITDPLGNVTTMSYDQRGRVASVTDAEGAITRYEYDERSNRTNSIDPLGRLTSMTYDAAGNMTSLTDPAGKVTRWEYDPMGRVTKVTDPGGGETRYEYQPGGGCTSGCGSGGGGLLTSVTDPSGHKTSFEYDAAGRMTGVVNPLGIRRQYTYDLAGRLVKFKNARGQEITYQYDLSNNLVKKTLPDEGDTDYAYDSSNRLTGVTDADSILRYEYAAFTGMGPYFWDAGYQLKGSKIRETFGMKDDPRYSKQIPGSAKYSQGTDYTDLSTSWQSAIELLGKIVMQVDDGPSMQFQLEYDTAHRVYRSGEWCPHALFTYDRVGRRKTMTVKGCGPCDGGGPAVARSPSVAKTSASTMLWGSGTPENKTSYSYDAAGQLRSIVQTYDNDTESDLPVASYTYEYDQAGNRTSMTDGAGIHAYGYDSKYQLVSATHSTEPSEYFGYDAAGNRTTSHISPTYAHNDANQLLQDAEFTYTYDGDGNCIGKISKLDGTRHEYIFNSENRMTGYRKYDINSNLLTAASYFYDPFGRRIAKEVDGALTRYLYQDEDIWMTIDPDGTVTRVVHGPGIDEPIAHSTGGQEIDGTYPVYTYYFADALGTIRDLHIRDCDILTGASYDFDSFGQPTSNTTLPATGPAYAFTGREWDAESETYYYRSRHYDPHAGRFLASDPQIRVSDYSYANQDPILYTDPFGLQAKEGPGALAQWWRRCKMVRRVVFTVGVALYVCKKACNIQSEACIKCAELKTLREATEAGCKGELGSDAEALQDLQERRASGQAESMTGLKECVRRKLGYDIYKEENKWCVLCIYEDKSIPGE